MQFMYGRNLSQIIKLTYEKPTTNITFNDEKLKVGNFFFKIQSKTKMSTLPIFIQNNTENPSQKN